MTDAVNRDGNHSLFFDFYIDSPKISSHITTETSQVLMSGRSWEVTVSETIQTPKPQLFFAAKSGKLFNRASA